MLRFAIILAAAFGFVSPVYAQSEAANYEQTYSFANTSATYTIGGTQYHVTTLVEEERVQHIDVRSYGFDRDAIENASVRARAIACLLVPMDMASDTVVVSGYIERSDEEHGQLVLYDITRITCT